MLSGMEHKGPAGPQCTNGQAKQESPLIGQALSFDSQKNRKNGEDPNGEDC